MADKKVLFVIAFEGFRDEEYIRPKQILEQKGVTVVTASTQMGTASGKLGMQVPVDILYTKADLDEYHGLIFIGGPGSPGYWEDAAAHLMLRGAASSGKLVAGICSACVTLAKSGVLTDRRATVWAGDASILKPLVGQYTAATCEEDGLFITANGPDAAEEFGEKLALRLGN